MFPDMAPTTPAPTIDYTLARSWLLAPVLDAARLDAAGRSAADSVVLDLEDATPAADKADARAAALAWLEKHNAWVRVNGATTEFWRDDLKELRGAPGLSGVVLAESTSSRELDRTAALLGGHTPLVALVESAAGLEAVGDIAAVPAVGRLAFGVNDFRRDTGFGASPMALAYARSKLVLASRIAAIAAPIDGPCGDTAPRAVADAADVTVEMGMTGKLALHPGQAPVLNTHLSPGADEIAWAEALVERLGEDGSGITNGSDLPRLARAKKLLEHARDFGLVTSAGA